MSNAIASQCGCRTMAVQELPKLHTRVRFPPPAGFLLVVLLAAAGCAPYQGEGPAAALTSSVAMTHRVERGETLWSIAHRYGVSAEDLKRQNRISDVSRLEIGQRLVIPARRGAQRPAPKDAPPRASAQRPAPAETAPRAPAVFSAPVVIGRGEEFIWPVQGRVISIFGTRRRGRVSKGIDIQAPSGTEVRATRSGRVSFVHEGLPGFGKTIILEHANGFASVYAYVKEILVRQGDQVAQRQVIARVGETGRTEVPALHFEIRQNQKAKNPLHYLP